MSEFSNGLAEPLVGLGHYNQPLISSNILKITNIPSDLTPREARAMFALVIDDIINIEIKDFTIWAYFQNFQTCSTTGKLLDGKFIFGKDLGPIKVEFDQLLNSPNSSLTNFNNLRLSQSQPSQSSQSQPQKQAGGGGGDFQKRQSITRSRFLFSDPFNANQPQSSTNQSHPSVDLPDLTAKSLLFLDTHENPWKSQIPLNSAPHTPGAGHPPFDWNSSQAQASGQPPSASNDRRRTSSAFFNSNLLQGTNQNAALNSINSSLLSPPNVPAGGPTSHQNNLASASQAAQLSSQASTQQPPSQSQSQPQQQPPSQPSQSSQPQPQPSQQSQPQQPQQQSQAVSQNQQPPQPSQSQPGQQIQQQLQNSLSLQSLQLQSQNQQQSQSGSQSNSQSASQNQTPQISPDSGQNTPSTKAKDIPDLSLLARVPPPANPADQNPPCNTLYVGNLPPDATELELRALFSPQKGFRRLSFRTKNQSLSNSSHSGAHNHGPMCFVEFEDVAHATRALAELYGRTLPRPGGSNGKGGIRLSFSKNPLGVRGPGNPRRSSSNQLNATNNTSSASSSNAIGNYGYLNYSK